MKPFKYLQSLSVIILLFITLVKCQDVYVPKELDHDDQILVINGGITDDGGPHKVTISWATPFYETIPAYVSNATVTVEDGNGQIYVFSEQEPGRYYTPENSLVGEPSQSYKLIVLIDNGTRYESEMTTMSEPNVGNIYAEAGEKGFLTETSDGVFSEEVFQGLYVYTDLDIETDEKQYFRFESLLAEQTYFSFDTAFQEMSPPVTIYVRCIDVSYLNPYPEVKATIRDGERQIVKKQPLGFIPYKMKTKYYNWPYVFGTDTMYSSRGFSSTLSGWVVTVSSYSVSDQEYTYYSKVREQLTASNQIFDPLPSSLHGNIRCITNEAEPVFGFFSVAAKEVHSLAMNWWPRSSLLVYKPVENYPYTYPLSLLNDSTIPEGWVGF